jgi:uncharacterized protein GlcG (DUF336 family)
MKHRRKQSLLDRKRQRTRLMCELLEPRLLLAADDASDVTSLLDSLDSLTFTVSDDGSAEVAVDSNLDADPGSLAAFLADSDASIAAAGDAASVAEMQTPEPRHNSINPLDVDVSGSLTPLDALLVINHLNYGDPSLTRPDDPSAPGVFYTDVDGDGTITPADADAVIEALNTPPVVAAPHALALAGLAEGEAPPPPPPHIFALPPGPIPSGDAAKPYITAAEADNFLSRAAGATSSQDAIIAIVDRGGRILGVRVEQGVLNNIHDQATLIFAIDGAVAKARTAAFFANDQAPLTSRTIRSLSQSTIIQREVESNPTVVDPSINPLDPANAGTAAARTYGPGTVAAIGLGGHFPPDIAHTPPVDLFNIELQSRDSLRRAGIAGIIKGTTDDISVDPNNDVILSNRFNVPTDDLPVINGMPYDIPAPVSYGVQSGLEVQAVGRGLATLPGGVPLLKAIRDPGVNSPFTVVGGIGVFFPGLDGYATHEQGFVKGANQTSTQRLNSKKELEAEYIAAKTAGVYGGALKGYTFPNLNTARIDLVGITLEIVGPNPTAQNHNTGLETVRRYGQSLGTGNSNSGANQKVDVGGDFTIDGQTVPDGWLIEPHDSPLGDISQADVERIVNNSIVQANKTRAAIRLDVSKNPPVAGVKTKMVIAVADKAGNVLGLYRMHDATFFSIDVAVAKARNTAYYADPAALQNADKVDDDLLVQRGAVTVAQLNKLGDKNNGGVVGTPDLFPSINSGVRYSPLTGLAFTNRTFRFLAEPRYPSGVDGSLPPVFSILTDPGINRRTGENTGAPTPASKFTSVMGFDAFHTSRNFHDLGDANSTPPLGVNGNALANQNGIVFFPGSTPLYKTRQLAGGFGISGDGVDQDDVVTSAGQAGYDPPQNLRADMLFYRGVRLPYQKFNRNPQG